MNSLYGFARERNHISTCVEWSNPIIEMPAAPSTAAGAYLSRRYHVPTAIADLVAALAGLGLEEARR
jgi:hypothetical protein